MNYGHVHMACHCNYVSHNLLDCNFNEYWIEYSETKIELKYYGTVEWINFDANSENIYVPIVDIVNKLYDAYDLNFINNKWNFKLSYHVENAFITESIKMNVKAIKQDGSEKFYLARCRYLSRVGMADFSHYIYLKCIADGEDQDISDLIYISNTTFYNSSIIWRNKNDINTQIKRITTLKFVKTYEYINNSYIKFLVENVGNLPNKAEIKIDIYAIYVYPDNQRIFMNNPKTAVCIYENNMLTCGFNATSEFLIKLASIKYKGTTIWTNLQDRIVTIPKNHTLTFERAYNLFFLDKWYFIVEVKKINDLTSYSTVIIDIIQNSQETTATCEYIKNTNDITCYSDYDIQSSHDIVKLNINRKYGSISWENNIEDNTIIGAYKINRMDINFRDAYDMYFSSQKKWIFSIYAEEKNWISRGLVNTNIYVTKSDGTQFNALAQCLIHTKDLAIIKMICQALYTNQEKEDLIKMNPNIILMQTNIFWNNLYSYSPIVLKTSLFLEKYEWEKGINNKYILNIKVKDNGILPVGSKVVLDINTRDFFYWRIYLNSTNCTATKNNLIYCGDAGYMSLDYLKTPDSSVRWLNDKNDDSFRFSINRKANIVSADRLYYLDIDKKWHFNLTLRRDFVPPEKFSLKADILYGNVKKIANCINREYTLCCQLDESNQDRNTLIQYFKENYYRQNIIAIPLWTELTFEKAEHLRFEKKSWNFNIKVKDENIPENSVIYVDIDIIYSLIDQDFERFETANCTYKSKILICDYKGRDIDYLYCIKIMANKINSSISTVPKWNNVKNDKISIYLDVYTGFISSTRIY